MTVKEGDLVRFLNATGGGKVTRIDKNTSTVYVKDDTGFELPARISEVVVVTEGSTIVPKVPVHTGQAKAPAGTAVTTSKEKDARKRDLAHLGKVNAYLCFLPEEGKKPGEEGGFEAYLVNDSQYDLVLTYTSGEDNLKRTLRYQGVIPFDSVELIDTLRPGTDLDRRTRSSFVLVPIVRDETFTRKEPFVVELKVEGGKFYKAGAFEENDFFDDKAIIYRLVEGDKPFQSKKIDADTLAEKMMTKGDESLAKKENRARVGEARRPGSSSSKGTPLVVDLHASELLETTAGMDSKAILEYQLEEVRRVMKAHRRPADKGLKIVFIHGKGEGILREAVEKLIRREFPRCLLQDASFREYGFGATQVTVH